jgi:hypothetical protein
MLDDTNPEKIKTVLQQGLREYNRDFFGDYQLKRFATYSENASKEIIAGVYGFILPEHNTMRLEA